jgi:hypothetical protein
VGERQMFPMHTNSTFIAMFFPQPDRWMKRVSSLSPAGSLATTGAASPTAFPPDCGDQFTTPACAITSQAEAGHDF